MENTEKLLQAYKLEHLNRKKGLELLNATKCLNIDGAVLKFEAGKNNTKEPNR